MTLPWNVETLGHGCNSTGGIFPPRHSIAGMENTFVYNILHKVNKYLGGGGGGGGGGANYS
jgi:hypothetical protein